MIDSGWWQKVRRETRRVERQGGGRSGHSSDCVGRRETRRLDSCGRVRFEAVASGLTGGETSAAWARPGRGDAKCGHYTWPRTTFSRTVRVAACGIREDRAASLRPIALEAARNACAGAVQDRLAARRRRACASVCERVRHGATRCRASGGIVVTAATMRAALHATMLQRINATRRQ